MISQLTGIIILRDDPYIIISVHDVGYKILASSAVLRLVQIGETSTIFTYTCVREDALELYGFVTYADLKLFELLITVSGIGPKTAIGVFSLGTSSDILSAIATGNVAFFSAVPRLGKKNAQKIIIELKNKIGATGDLDVIGKSEEIEDVLSALQSFGFSAKEVSVALAEINADGKTTEQKIRLALKYLGK
ncbi:MAG: Holliday junction branch migration protein RuvA [Candidatus Levybacteria bacterium]|nr:Holliday junction branch migration protein RuvA [Candidatus Levybacteria bacterium]